MAGISNPNGGTYDPPAKFVEDSSAIPAGTITKYQLGLGQASKTYTIIRDDVDLTPNAQGKQTVAISLSGLAFGQWFAAVRAVSKDGPASPWSNEDAFTVDAKTPEAPRNFSVA